MDYKNGKIYTIRSKETDLYYIGATVAPLSKRFNAHKRTTDCRSREIMKYPDAYIELYEVFPCANKEELNKREGELQREFKHQIVNCRVEGRTHKKYYEDNKDKIITYQSKWQAEHKEIRKIICDKHKTKYPERIKESQKKYYAENKEKVDKRQREYNEKNKVKHAEYYQKNKIQIAEKKRIRALEKKAENLK